jgi:hypothetical protein
VSEVERVEVRSEQAATMFGMNIQSWRRQPFVRATWTEGLVDELEEALGDRAAGRERATDIHWGFRRCVLERR